MNNFQPEARHETIAYTLFKVLTRAGEQNKSITNGHLQGALQLDGVLQAVAVFESALLADKITKSLHDVN